MPVNERTWLADRFEEHRAHLRAVAYRMLGSPTEADDAVQETWLKVSRADAGGVENVGGWLTTIVARVALDMLRARASRREEPLDRPLHAVPDDGADPEAEAMTGDAVGLALLVVLDTLEPAERLAFVLHDLFGMPFDEIAPIVDRSPPATRQLASRARRRVRGAGEPAPDRARQREVVEAFLAASRRGDFEALVARLDPDAVMRADAAAIEMGSPARASGAHDVAEMFSGRARAARMAVIDGSVGAVWSREGRPVVAFEFSIADDRVLEIALVAAADRLDGLSIEPLE
jgi:RNA polymerase sigma-70 factor (ECF subfamily)